ncbi:patatin-like phospholipase family protein [Actinospica sp. MGRD01-02]|uniref:Patatin-like phospholipase family protein n=1 Tax=Actinospica acidithermotolerans TaxID=2828514 RepID=A0A941EC54_9ACTN|nr:patatin-like phospholipase family protein [Actinospica acidithermotolerans]MBR7826314.1 patatin-like phospholipase family protein [Actinospica acidithermotolerans]
MTKQIAGPIAFVLGGGGVRGGYQAGMIRALLERGVRPDLVVGTSVGAIQGALLAADPTPAVAARMGEFWHQALRRGVLRPGAVRAVRSLRTGQLALGSGEPLRQLLVEYLGDGCFEELAVPLQTCAASIERATARYFQHGPLIPAVMASCAMPGLLPAYRIGDEHFVDGGVVEEVPIARAVGLGARTVLVLRAERPERRARRERRLRVPRWPWQVDRMSFELSRRHHLGVELERRPEGVSVHEVDAGFLAALDESRVTVTAVRISAFAAGKFDRFFDLCDQNRDDAVAETDLLALGARIAEACGARAGSLGHQRLEEAFTAFWLRLRAAAGLEEIEAKSLRREDFRRSLARLSENRAAYDQNVHPLIASLTAAADENADEVLSPAEVSSLLRALGVAEGDADRFVLLLDTYNNGELTLEELDEAFCHFFTDAEPGPVGNLILGGGPAG